MALRIEKIGPAALVAAAFIGPGTVATASRAGADYGTALLWALLFSVFATLILQEMALRLGVVARQNLAEALKQEIQNPFLKFLALLLVGVAIIGGAIAYEAGNIIGAALGLEGLLFVDIDILVPVMGTIAAAVLWFGKQDLVEKVFIVLVGIMSLCFLLTAIMVGPELLDLLSGFKPSIPSDSILLIVALIGTTVVPYNLFLHSALATNKYYSYSDLDDARSDNSLFIILGGIVSMSIVVTASAAFAAGGGVNGASDMAKQLEPLLGSHASLLFSMGLLAAGITSSITAPMAAGFVCQGAFSWESAKDESDNIVTDQRVKLVWLAVVVIGTVIATLDYKPIYIITAAQYANGLILPLMVAFLLYAMNKRKLLGEFVNTRKQNAFGVIVLVVSLILSARSFGVFS